MFPHTHAIYTPCLVMNKAMFMCASCMLAALTGAYGGIQIFPY